VPLIGDTFSHVPGCRVTENAAGPESLVTEIVAEYGVALQAGAMKARLVGAHDITGTTALVTVSVTGRVVDGGPKLCVTMIDAR
jgi:hypothetical protein